MSPYPCSSRTGLLRRLSVLLMLVLAATLSIRPSVAETADPDPDERYAALMKILAASFLETQKLNADVPAAGGELGTSVSIDGDFALVGAPYNSSTPGSAYIFRYNGATWNQIRTLTPTAGTVTTNDGFGFSVALDGSRAVIGAPRNSTGGLETGAIYIFEDTDAAPLDWAGTITEDIITAPTPVILSLFGLAVSLSGTTAVVGAQAELPQGRAYIIDITVPSAPVTTTLVTPGTVTSAGGFGRAVSIDGNTVAISASNDTQTPASNGAVYIWEGPAWTQTTTLLPVTLPLSAGDQYGSSISVDGGGTRILVGATQSGIGPGKAYVFDRPGTGWADIVSETDAMIAPGGSGSRFGASVALSGSVALIGAPYDETAPGADEGAAYVFEFDGVSSWLPEATTPRLTASDMDTEDFFGAAVSLDGGRALIGAPQNNDGAPGAGSAYVFDVPALPILTVDNNSIVINEGPTAAVNTGTVYAAHGDLLSMIVVIGGGGVVVEGDTAWTWTSPAPLDGPDDTQLAGVVADATVGNTLATFDLTVNNVAPVLSGLTNQAATAGTSTVFTLGSFTDPGPDSPWQITVDWDDSSPDEVFTEAAAGPITSQAHTYAAAGVYTVTVTVDEDDDIASDSQQFDVTVTSSETTLASAKDAILRPGAKQRNEGANPLLHLGENRRLVAGFDLSGVGDVSTVTSATLILTINDENDPGNWGSSGRTIDAHRLLEAWQEGDGKGMGLPNSEKTRGSGSGVTWKCGIDTAIENQKADCVNPAWNGGNFASTASDQFLMTNGATGEATWDVTADVQAGADSWLLKKTSGSGNARFYAKEHPDVGGTPDLAPRLVLDFGGGGARLAAGGVAPVLETLADEAPSGYTLAANYPNPFNPETTIRFTVPSASYVRLVVYDVLGRQVRVLVDGMREAGTHAVRFEAGSLPSGTYLYRLETPGGHLVQAMQVVK